MQQSKTGLWLTEWWVALSHGWINTQMDSFASLAVQHLRPFRAFMQDAPLQRWKSTEKHECTLFFLSFVILGPHPQHMEVPRLGFKLELLPPAYAGATATPDPNRVCDLHHSSQHRQILNPLSEVGNLTCNLMVPSCFRCATMGPPWVYF